MNIVPFIQKQKENNIVKSNQIKDFSVFDFNYIPKEPLMREESEHLITEMMRFEMSGIGMLIFPSARSLKRHLAPAAPDVPQLTTSPSLLVLIQALTVRGSAPVTPWYAQEYCRHLLGILGIVFV